MNPPFICPLMVPHTLTPFINLLLKNEEKVEPVSTMMYEGGNFGCD